MLGRGLARRQAGGDAAAMTDPLPRSVPLDGASNLRDLGGYQAMDGRRLRFGRLYRSATLANLTPRDGETVAALGLRTVVDFRGVAEAAKNPSRLPPGAERVPLAIEPLIGASLADLMRREMATGEDVVQLLGQAYVEYTTTWLPQYRALFALMLEPERHALLFHCSAGKDRTGVGAALVLLALGVPQPTILADYAATDRLWRKDFPMPPETPKPLLDALYATHPEMLERALAAGIAPYGELSAMLERGLGLDADRLARLRDLFLE
jgi:protein-tyrosine phosphatase